MSNLLSFLAHKCVKYVFATCLIVAALPLLAVPSNQSQDRAGTAAAEDTTCHAAGPKQCLELAIQAMGGHELLESIRVLRLDEIGHTALMEQSYRQEPFITSYQQAKETIDFAQGRFRLESRLTWPEAAPGQSTIDSTIIGTAEGAVRHGSKGDTPASAAELDAVRQTLALDPARVLLAASTAPDLHFVEDEVIRSTRHISLAFNWQGLMVRVELSPFNHLPDAVETVRTFRDFWYFWGDVRQRIYLEGYQIFQGLIYPTNQVEERNGVIWKSTQVLNVEINPPTEDSAFKMDAVASAQSAKSVGWDRTFVPQNHVDLAPGITLFLGSWNSTIVKQDDGIYILEAPISGPYIQGVIDEAKKRYPSLPIKGVFSTSDSWPHTGGMRECVAAGLRMYVLDLNRPLLEREIAAPHTIHPDLLAKQPRAPNWNIVSGKVVVGSGANRVELYPLRGASTERQYMVYFPEHGLLYASDTLALNADGSLYDPELMREVEAAVNREHLPVRNVFAMHQGLMEWQKVEALVAAALAPPVSAVRSTGH